MTVFSRSVYLPITLPSYAHQLYLKIPYIHCIPKNTYFSKSHPQDSILPRETRSAERLAEHGVSTSLDDRQDSPINPFRVIGHRHSPVDEITDILGQEKTDFSER